MYIKFCSLVCLFSKTFESKLQVLGHFVPKHFVHFNSRDMSTTTVPRSHLLISILYSNFPDSTNVFCQKILFPQFKIQSVYVACAYCVSVVSVNLPPPPVLSSLTVSAGERCRLVNLSYVQELSDYVLRVQLFFLIISGNLHQKGWSWEKESFSGLG